MQKYIAEQCDQDIQHIEEDHGRREATRISQGREEDHIIQELTTGMAGDM